MTPELIEMLKKKASQKTISDIIAEDDDKCIFDFSGSNVDDAYESGVYTGEVDLAREILSTLGIEYTIEED